MNNPTQLRWTCLKDNPTVKEEIKTIIERLNEVLYNDEKRHLADVGLVLRFVSTDLEEISKRVFKLHNDQKNEKCQK